MILAGEALQHNNIGRALKFLNRKDPPKPASAICAAGNGVTCGHSAAATS